MIIDAVAILTILVVALVGIPSQLIVGPLGRAGTPAEILGVCLLVAWLVLRVGRSSRTRQVRQPVRILLWVFVIAVVLSYIAANTRSMMPAEATSADAGLLLVCAWLGIMLMTMDLVRSRDRLDVLLRRVVLAGGALATLGILQFVTKEAWTNYIQIPALRANKSLVGIYGRAGFTRPAGTAVHPIEFGAVLTMILPLALHFALTDVQRRPIRRWYPVLAIAFAVPISISRSAVVSLIVVLCVLLPTWSASVRRRAYAAIVGLGGAVYVAVPGLLGTITHLFTGASNDASTQSRTDSYSLAFEFIARTPFFGRGFLTFLPEYRILDDQYLGLLIETGIVGLAAFLGLLVSGALEGLRVRRLSANPRDGSLGVALAASIASALASFALFDAFAFPMAAGVIFLVLGSVGALRRIAVAREPLRPMAGSLDSLHPESS